MLRMDPLQIKIVVEIVGGSITAGAAVFGVIKGLQEWHRATEQRKEELLLRRREFRHKQAMFAKELVKEVFQDKKARAALKMLDWLRSHYEDEQGRKYEIRRAEIQSALRTTEEVLSGREALSDKDVFIRTCFESLYDHFEELENLIKVEIINFDDIETAFRYYMIRLLRQDVRHLGFLHTVSVRANTLLTD